MDKGLIARLYEELKKLNMERTNTSFNKWADEHTVLKRRTNGQ
jgi:hypothetical protein